MSTSETDEFELGPCPCGRGQIIRRVTTQDNPWSSADISDRIQCASCASGWRLEGQSLVKIQSERPYYAARHEKEQSYSALRKVSDPLVDAYFQAFSAKTKKAEHAEMARLDIYVHSYRSFFSEKKENKTWSGIAYGLRNLDWLGNLARQANIEAEFHMRLKDWKDAEQRTTEAYRIIERRPIPPLTLKSSG